MTPLRLAGIPVAPHYICQYWKRHPKQNATGAVLDAVFARTARNLLGPRGVAWSREPIERRPGARVWRVRYGIASRDEGEPCVVPRGSQDFVIDDEELAEIVNATKAKMEELAKKERSTS